jgi:hypothetical protein
VASRRGRRAIAPGLLSLALLLLGFAAPAEANDSIAPISGDLSAATDGALEKRLRFLTTRFEAGERYARYWQTGFTTAWASGIVVGSVQASLSSEPDNRVPAIVTATKGVIGTTRLLLSPHPARLGAAPLDVERENERATLEARVIAGERQLLAIEKRAERRTSWIPHLANAGLNLAGGGVIFALGNPSDAIQNVAIGIAFGELMIWTQPRRGIRDSKDYRALVAKGVRLPRKPPMTISVAPTSRGGLLQIRF